MTADGIFRSFNRLKVRHANDYYKKPMTKLLSVSTFVFFANQIIAQQLNKDWPVLKTYEGIYFNEVSMPLGGIGTGGVSLGEEVTFVIGSYKTAVQLDGFLLLSWLIPLLRMRRSLPYTTNPRAIQAIYGFSKALWQSKIITVTGVLKHYK